MQISKTEHLKRLLQTQDVVLTGLTFAVVVDGLWFLGFIELNETLRLMKLLPLAMVLAVGASRMFEPRLHDQSVMAQASYALRYAAVVVFGLVGVVYVAELKIGDRLVFPFAGGLLAAAILVNRLFLRWWYLVRNREHPDNYLKVLIIGTGARAQKIISTYKASSDWGVEVIGMLDPDEQLQGTVINGIPVLGGLSRVGRILETKVVDEVLVCLPRGMIDHLDEIVHACEEEAVCLKFMADLYDIDADAVSLERLGGHPVISFQPVSYHEGARVVKRIADLLLTTLSMPIILPVFALIALAIKLDSPGPVFFSQERVGLNKRRFKMIKFRSMHKDAEARLKEVEHLNEADGPIFKIKNDPRVTRVGRFLRKTSIDELPQLFNVLRGQMSLIGPRPMSIRDVTLFTEGAQRKRFSVRPGLACLREVSGRSNLSFGQWLELDLKYIDEWSLWLDLKILLKLIPVVVRGEGAS